MNVVKVVGLSLALLVSACDPAPPRKAEPASSPGTAEQRETSAEAQIYSTVIRRLVTKDHTFGQAASPFEYVYVVDGAVPKAANVLAGFRHAHQPFPGALKRSIMGKLENLPPLDFVKDPESVLIGRFPGDAAVRNQGVLIRLGPIRPSGNKLEVGTGLHCGGTCGQWLTYVLSRQGGVWRITGTTGPYAIA